MTQAKPKLAARAAAIKAASKGNPALVVVTSDSSILKSKSITASLNSLDYVACGCKDCGTKILASVSTPEPFCISCGSDNVVASTKLVKAQTERAGSLMSVACPSCNHSNVIQASTMKALKTIHCVQCSTHLKAEAAPGMNTDGNPVNLRNDGDIPGGIKIVEPAPEEQNFNGKNDKGVEINADAMCDELEELDEVAAASWPANEVASEEKEADGDKKPPTAPKDESESAEAKDPSEPKDAEEPKEAAAHDDMEEIDAFLDDGADEVEEIEESNVDSDSSADWSEDASLDDDLAFDGTFDSELDDGSAGEDDRVIIPNDMSIAGSDDVLDDLGLEDPAIVASKAVKAAKLMEIAEFDKGEPLYESASLDDTANACYFIQSGTKLLAMKGHFCVATLTPERAGANTDVMYSDGFAAAVHHQMASMGMRKALAAFNFSPVRTPILTQASVKAAITNEAKKVQAANKEADAVTAECFAIAAVGLARGMWSKQPNALKAAFEAELSNRGERRPGRLAASLFSKYGLDYTKTLCEIASKLKIKSKAARIELADTLDMISEEPMQEVDTIYNPDAQDELNEAVISDADEMPMNDYSAEGMDDDMADEFGDDDDIPVDAVTARFSRPGRPVQANSRQIPAIFRPRNAEANSQAVTAAHKILSGNERLSFD